MPTATLESTAPEIEEGKEATAQVINNPFIYNAPIRTATLMSHVKLLDEKGMTDAGRLKRILRGLFRDYAHDRFDDDTGKRIQMWQDDAKRKLAGLGFEKWIAEGYLNKVLEGYLSALAQYHYGNETRLEQYPVTDPEAKNDFNRVHDREEALGDKYKLELDYVRKYSDAIRKTALEYRAAIEAGEDLPFGKIVAQYILKEPDKAKALDMVNNVLAAGVAHSIKILAAPLTDTSSENIARYQEDPKAYAIQIRALAEKVREHTKNLSFAHVHVGETEDVMRMQGLQQLFSGGLNYALDPKQSAEDLIGVLAHIRPIVQDYKNVTMSLAYHFLGKGPGASDARMKALQAEIKEALGGEVMPLEQAEIKAIDLARSSAQDLMQVADGKPELQAKLKGLLGQVSPELANEPLETRQGIIGNSVKATIGAFLKLSKKLQSMFGMGNETGTSRAA
jgi:hypothetical protein